MGTDKIRAQSRAVLSEHGLSVPDDLPYLSPPVLRPLKDMLSRLFCLNAIAAASYGFDRSKALAWLGQEHLNEELTHDERLFLEHGQGDREAFKLQVEGMWGLAWAASLVSEMDFWRDCDPQFVALLPNLKIAEGVEKISFQAKTRSPDQVVAACDLSYCLHWTIREAIVRNERLPRNLKPYVVIERRRALEWILGDEAWDAVNLDT